ncbi:MAG: alpha/beta fold hydrolase [Planctomycetota bacterium]|nr:alpha/beta fold hydrolase [Planctomycetota bacterium]
MLKQSLVLFFALITPAGFACAEDVLAVKERGEGLHKETGALSDGTTVRYTVLVPKGYKAGKKGQKKLPLVLALHYGGRVTPFYGAGLVKGLIGPAFKKLNAIIVAPDSLGFGWRGGKDEKYVLALLAGIEKAYSVDKKREIVSGFSMGGMGSWYFAGKYPKRFSAMVAVAGRPLSKNIKIPVFAIHSKIDKVVPFAPTEAWMNELKKKGHNAKLLVLEDLKHYEVSKYIPATKKSVAWILKVWKSADKAKKPSKKRFY